MTAEQKRCTKQRMTLKITETLATMTHSYCVSPDVCITVGIIFIYIRLQVYTFIQQNIIYYHQIKGEITATHTHISLQVFHICQHLQAHVYFSSFFMWKLLLALRKQLKTIVWPPMYRCNSTFINKYFHTLFNAVCSLVTIEYFVDMVQHKTNIF